MKLILNLISYNKYKWLICADCKVISLVCGMQGGWPSYPCFKCLFPSRLSKVHWIKKKYEIRKKALLGAFNIINTPLISTHRVLFPTLHLKLGLMTIFVKSLDKSGAAYRFLTIMFGKKSDSKIAAGTFNGPDIRKLMKSKEFYNVMTPKEKKAWKSFESVCKNFLGNNRAANYKTIVSELITNFKKQGTTMSTKLHFLKCHLNEFPENNGAVSDETGERFHTDIKKFEKRYSGKSQIAMLSDFIWSTIRS